MKALLQDCRQKPVHHGACQEKGFSHSSYLIHRVLLPETMTRKHAGRQRDSSKREKDTQRALLAESDERPIEPSIVCLIVASQLPPNKVCKQGTTEMPVPAGRSLLLGNGSAVLQFSGGV